MSQPSLVLQTWTILDRLRDHPAGTLSAIADMGFKYLELAGNAGMSPVEFAELCREKGFTVIGVHQPPLTSANLNDLIEETVGHCEAYKCSFATVMLDKKDAETDGADRQEAFLRYASLASEAGQRLRDHNITLCYHCYPYDLEPVDGPEGPKSGLDILLERVAPQDMAVELDVHFIYRAGVPEQEVFQKCGRRCKLVHINDVTELGEDGRSAVLGEGQIDWAQVMGHIHKCSEPKWFVLEHTCPEPLAWLRKSFDYWRDSIAQLSHTGGGPR